MTRPPPRNRDGGFTLIELLITVAIMGVITVPLANFVIAYFANLTQTQARLSASHDVQIAAAYFSQDVQEMNQLVTPTGSSCGSARGTTVLLMTTDDWTVANNTGTDNVHNIAYVAVAGTLHRIYCASGSTISSDATIVHNYASASVSCIPSCTGAPSSVTLNVTINSSGDTQTVPFVGDRRESS
jgi:prepilin-type N-terminal cleavage/methylation domain-containing protein